MTTTTNDGAGVGGIPPDPAAAVERVLAEADADPAPRRVKTSTERVRKHRKKLRRSSQGAGPEPSDEGASLEVTDDDVRSAIPLGATVWEIVGPMFRLRKLEPKQEERLGRALAPLMKKYLPLLADWQHEVAFGLVVFSLVRETREPVPVEGASGNAGE